MKFSNMFICLKCLLGVLTFLSILKVSYACDISPDANFTRPARYWCSLEARVSITTTCHTEVEETIIIPWSTGMVDRVVPAQENQRIESLMAFRMLNGNRIAVYSTVRWQSPPGNLALALRVSPTTGPVTLLVRYKMTGGVQIFSQCSGIGDFKQISSSPENSLMISKWAVGGRSAAEMRRIGVTFVLPQHQRIRYVDTLTTVPAVFKQESYTQHNESNTPVTVRYDGLATGVLPSELFFYVRFIMNFGVQSCPLSRNCEAEDMILKEGMLRKSNHKTILGLTLGLGFTLIVIAIVAWVCCCKCIREKQRDLDFDENLPVSIRHFAYDTGDEQQRQKREEWTEASPKSNRSKEEFYALDLSPKNRGKRSSDF